MSEPKINAWRNKRMSARRGDECWEASVVFPPPVVFAVHVTFNPRSRFADLPPRFQMWDDGRTVTYATRGEAQAQVDVCSERSSYPMHTYEVREYTE